MSSSRHANPSQKARQSRIYRRNQKEQKRFEAPLREFIEIKYKDIFEEYTELYNQMVAENPKKKNLNKSKTFKRWKTTNQHSNPNDILSRAMRETLEKETPVLPEIEQAEESEAGQNQAEQSETEQQAEESEAGENQAEQSETEQDERLLAAQQLDDLVNQMAFEDELRAILEEPEQDEGIELNIHDELGIDIEPFDYRLEVELGEW